MIPRSLVLTLVTVAITVPLSGQVPSFAEVTGHAFGERVTQHHEMVRYLERLVETSPRVRIVRQGVSWEERELMLAIVTSPENHARLEEIQANARRLGDPRTLTTAEADALIATQPTILWFGGSIHGFELSGSEGVLQLLEHLTTQDDDATRTVLQNAVVLIDPMLNPDGRDAFAHINHENIGREPNPLREDWANTFTGWQGLKFRTGHYYFDTNRDWFAHTQRETRARIATLVAWRPQIVVDMHEMGADVEFYFDPADNPYGSYFPPFAFNWFQRFNEAYSSAFDAAGFQYMTRERYNYFYPGYTTSQGSYQGAVGMLYEQGSSRGLALTRPDESVRTLLDALTQQYTAAWAAVQYAAEHRTELLSDYVAGLGQAVADGSQGARYYFIAPGGDPSHRTELVHLLARGGIEVGQLSQSTTVNNVRDRTGQDVGQQSFPAGTFAIDAAQPHNRLIRVLLEPDIPLSEEFLALARHRVDRDENPRFYDITAWSLPLLFNLQVYSAPAGSAPPVEALGGHGDAATPSLTRPTYAYLIDGRHAATVSAIQALTSEGHRVAVTLRDTEIAGEAVPSGTAVIRLEQNDESIHDAVTDVMRRFQVDVRGVNTGLASAGPSLGSADVIPVRPANVAMLAEDPIRGYSFGWAWFTLDRQYEIPVTNLRVSMVATTPLDRFDTIVIPATSGSALTLTLGDGGVDRLTRWVRDGGTLVTIGGATDFARQADGLGIALESWYDTEEGEDAQQLTVPGAIFQARLDREYWLAAGYHADELPVLVGSNRVYRAPEGPPSSRQRVVATYDPERLKLSGHAWPESLARLRGGVFVYEERVGAGRVIAFAEEPNFRAYFRGANRLFLNAVVIGPSAP